MSAIVCFASALHIPVVQYSLPGASTVLHIFTSIWIYSRRLKPFSALTLMVGWGGTYGSKNLSSPANNKWHTESQLEHIAGHFTGTKFEAGVESLKSSLEPVCEHQVSNQFALLATAETLLRLQSSPQVDSYHVPNKHLDWVCRMYTMVKFLCYVHRSMLVHGCHWVNEKDFCTFQPLWTKNCTV